MRLVILLSLALSGTAFLPSSAHAQWRGEPRFPLDAQPPAATPPSQLPASTTRRSDGRLLQAGLVGAVAGFVSGAFLGYHAERQWFWCSCDDPGLLGTAAGAFAGPALLTPILVHKANDGRGSLRGAYTAAAMIGGLGLGGLFATESTPLAVALVFGTPVAQVISAVVIESQSAPGPEQRRER